mgnify:CR=1 FL=1
MSCTDGRDNNCNGLADCRDPACRMVPECFTCVPTGAENTPTACADGRDNDCDGATDCADMECASTPACLVVPNDVCERAARITVPGRASGDTSMARDDYTPGCGSSAAPDVAYAFVNPTRQTLVIDTIGSTYDTVLGVYRGACTPASLVRCDDDGAGMGVSSRVVLTDAEPGLYFVVVDGWSSSRGAYQLNVSVGLPENCANGVDDDGDGLVDCTDGDCRMDPRCFMCVPTGREGDAVSCRDGRDNDCDGLLDCADTGCSALPACCVATGPEAGFMACFDGRDNDCNGRTDCDDPQCATQPMCCRPTGVENTATACLDGVDNDCNGRVDCADPGCSTQPRCCVPGGTEGDARTCTDGIDDDCDGLVDCTDPQCAGFGMCPCVPTAEACNNGRDDDCDGRVDCADPQCAMAPNCIGCTVTGDESSTTQCTDGRDNDCDGATDCADTLCATVQGCAPPPPNDTCRAPQVLTIPSSVSGITVGANNDFTPNTSIAGCAGGAGGDMVFTFTLTAPATVDIDTVGSDFDTVLYVRRADCLAGAQVACNDDTGGLTSSVSFGASAGTYYVFLDGFGPDSRGNYTLSIRTRTAMEVCNNRVDDDGDGFIDCADRDCAASPLCRCVPAPETTATACADGRDNDCDGATDCADTDCRPFPMCCAPVAPENNARTCADGVDDDCDGLIDCADPECSAQPRCCRPTGPEFCTDGIDNDCNGLIDCADTRCATLPLCCRVTGGEGDAMTCADGRDNDCDGTTDCADPGCAAVSTCCRPTMTRETGVSACTNGRDDDCDGLADCADSDCHPSSDPNAECCNGRDDNRNAVIDEFACACDSNAQCSTVGVGGPFPSNTCWSTTFRVCAPRCDLLGGNSFCNSFFAGTRCNLTTGECVR